MRSTRLYLPQPLKTGTTISLDSAVVHYVRNVLRLKQYAPLVVFNGKGGEFSAKIQNLTRKSAVISIAEWIDREIESPIKIDLGLGISRGERMNFALQKAVELGVNRICPIISTRTVVQLKGERKKIKHIHWEKIVHNSGEQCGRNYLPIVASPEQLCDWILNKNGLKLFFDPDSDKTLQDFDRPQRHIFILSGPEGGFTDMEQSQAKAAGFLAIRLGPRILRAETAVLAAVAAIQTLWGDLGGCPE